jgi:hypothetical protein
MRGIDDQTMAGYWPWPTADHPSATPMNDIPKIVFSAKLKAEPGKDLVAAAAPSSCTHGSTVDGMRGGPSPGVNELLWTFYLRDDFRPPGMSFSEIQKNLTRTAATCSSFKLRHVPIRTPGENRTRDFLVRSQALCPLSYGGMSPVGRS